MGSITEIPAPLSGAKSDIAWGYFFSNAFFVIGLVAPEDMTSGILPQCPVRDIGHHDGKRISSMGYHGNRISRKNPA